MSRGSTAILNRPTPSALVELLLPGVVYCSINKVAATDNDAGFGSHPLSQFLEQGGSARTGISIYEPFLSLGTRTREEGRERGVREEGIKSRKRKEAESHPHTAWGRKCGIRTRDGRGQLSQRGRGGHGRQKNKGGAGPHGGVLTK